MLRVVFGDSRLPERFWDKVAPDPNSGCWLWTANVSHNGYGEIKRYTQMVRAHRWAYSVLVKPVPPDFVVDHLCRTRCCVNPDHLEAVSIKENLMRGWTRAAENVKKTHCPQGHPYDDKNTFVNNGRRHCRTCSANRNKQWYYNKEKRHGQVTKRKRILSQHVVSEIKFLINLGYSDNVLAAFYSISKGKISFIRHGRSWQFIDPMHSCIYLLTMVSLNELEQSHVKFIMEDEVNKITQLFEQGYTIRSISEMFNISSSTAKKIKYGKHRLQRGIHARIDNK